MIDLVYYNPKLRVYRNGTVERLFKEWRECKLKSCNKGYYRLRIEGVNILLHRFMGFCFLGLDIENLKNEIDHIDRNPSNNNITNLRIVTRQENCWNVRGRGYIWDELNKKFMAHIKLNNKFINLGYYYNEKDARQAYIDAKLKYHNITIGFSPS